MNLKDKKFAKFALVKEMLETSEVVRNFDLNQRGVQNVAGLIRKSGRVFLTGEGSSRIFPAKNFIANFQGRALAIATGTQGSFQALECDLSNWVVCGASNSGETKEIINLLVKLRDAGKKDLVAVTATKGSTLTKVANESIILSCGREKAVAATKSVVEQGLVYSAVLAQLNGCSCLADNQAKAADALTAAMETEIDPKIVAMLQKAPMIYFAGRNNGVAEELTLKTNEIVRNKSDYLEGTYLPWVNVSALLGDATPDPTVEALCDRLLTEGHVWVNPGRHVHSARRRMESARQRRRRARYRSRSPDPRPQSRKRVRRKNLTRESNAPDEK